MQSNSVEELRMCQTHCRTVDWANASVRFFYSQFHLYCIVVAELLHFYFIWFFSSQREVRWSWPFTSESWGWGAPKSFLLAKQQLQLLFFFSKSLSTSLPSHSKKVLNAMIMKTSILKLTFTHPELTFEVKFLHFEPHWPYLNPLICQFEKMAYWPKWKLYLHTNS